MHATTQTSLRVIQGEEAITEQAGTLQSEAVPDSETRHHHVIYLACPYSHSCAEIREERFRAATEAAASLVRRGYIVYSPITMTHPIDLLLAGDKNTLGSEYWTDFDQAFMDFCSEMIVINLPGWDSSEGIRREVNYFRSKGKPINLMIFAGSEFDISMPPKIAKIEDGA